MADSKSIIFPTDFSKVSLASLPWAKRLAAVLDAELHCIYVVQEPTIYASLEVATIPMPTVDEIMTGAQQRLDAFADVHFTKAGDHGVVNVLVGRPAEQICQYADDHQAAMIVMSTHGYSGLKHAVLGSTTDAVLHHATCPVLAVPSS